MPLSIPRRFFCLQAEASRIRPRASRRLTGCAAVRLLLRGPGTGTVGGRFGEARLVAVVLADRLEERLVVADGQVRLAVWRARISVARAALVQVNDPAGSAFGAIALVLDDIALRIECDDVGDAEGLAGDNQEIAALDLVKLLTMGEVDVL